MRWQEYAYGGCIGGCILVFCFLIIPLLWHAIQLALDPARSGSPCLSSAVMTAAIACSLIAGSAALSWCLRQFP